MTGPRRSLADLEDEAERLIGRVRNMPVLRAALRVNDARRELEAATLDFEQVRYPRTEG